MIRTIARREARSLFRTPLAWSLLSMAQFVLAYQFLAQIEVYVQFADKLRALAEPPGITDIVVSPTISVAALIMLFIVPVVTMSSFSGERRAGSMSLLYSAPITSAQIVLGKFLGIFALLIVLWLIAAVMPVCLMWGAPLDLGIYGASLLALLLLMATYAAVGLLCSSVFSQPAVAAVVSFGALITLWLIDWAVRLGQESSGLLSYLSSLNHFERLASGFLNSSDLAYFFIIIGVALYTTVWRLDGDRKPL